MRTIKIRLVGVLMFFTIINTAQEVKFGKVTKQELEETVYEPDSSASAVVLFRKFKLDYKYIQEVGFQIITSVHERVKIYNNEGFSYATVVERLYKDGGTKESLSNIKGFTYNLENGQIVKTKLKSSETFTTSLSKYRNEEKFTMPVVKEGSVIEYEYKINSPFAYSIDEVILQYDIPIKKQEVTISIPEYFSFKTNMKGYLQIMPEYSSISGRITLNSKQRSGDWVVTSKFDQNTINYTKKKTAFNMVNVPALKEEPFVNHMHNYRASMNYELQYVKYPQSTMKSYATSWEKVVKNIYESDGFGKQLETTRYFKDELQVLLNGLTTDAEKAGVIFAYVQKRMNWNGFNGKYAYEGVKKAFEEKTGNVADINLMLVAMMREAGLKANPVLISTRSHGVPLFPTREGFNYVAAIVEIDGNGVLLDASNKYTSPNLLPTRALNWMGRVIHEDGSSETVQVLPNKLSRESNMINVNLKSNGDIAGKFRKNYTDHNAYYFRNNYNEVDEDSYLEKLENDLNGLEISNYKVLNKEHVGKAIVETYDFFMESQLEVIGDKIYFSPLLFKQTKENPFKLEKRDYPIDFAFPWQDKYIINIVIPEGYKVTSKPEDISIGLENGMGSFRYKIVDQGSTGLQVLAEIKMNSAVLPAQVYSGIKELYKKIVEKEAEKVVLSKI
ncbi:DUF3857 domain-containing protein [Spongiimicrobium sp. 3-5]|uniref:DUF3857 domain-containing protein n=1 Tax=Spongiimicrobium sp. 3-5 TaxID=3332596 RepID=UPI0039817470